MTFLLCQKCIDSKYEPRWFVIMYGRQYGIPAVAHLLAPKKRYDGDEITAASLIKR